MGQKFRGGAVGIEPMAHDPSLSILFKSTIVNLVISISITILLKQFLSNLSLSLYIYKVSDLIGSNTYAKIPIILSHTSSLLEAQICYLLDQTFSVELEVSFNFS